MTQGAHPVIGVQLRRPVDTIVSHVAELHILSRMTELEGLPSPIALALDAPLLTRIREMILSGELAPGQRVTEEALAEKLGVSRTPVRNILPSLATQGLLEPAGRRGFAVKAFSEKESWEALELRAVLEGQAARMLAQSGATPAVLAALDACLERGDELFANGQLDREDEEAYGAMNEEFHHIIVEACDVPMLKTFVDRLNLVPFVAPSVIVFDQVGLRRAFELLFRAHGAHHSIVEAIRQHDGHRAESLFREHAHQQRFSMLGRRAEQKTREQEATDRPSRGPAGSV